MVFKELEIERIAVINLAAISEVILSIPVTRALKENYPNAKITMLVNVQARDVAEMNPYIENVIAYDKHGEHQGISGLISMINAVRGMAFDLAIAMNFSLKGSFIAWAAGIKYRIGYDHKFNKFFLTDIVSGIQQRIQHQTINYLQVLEPLKITTEDTSLTLALDEKIEKIVDVTMFLNADRPNVVFCPINLHRMNSSLSESKTLKIIDELEQFANVYLIGGVKEQPLLSSIAEKADLSQERVLAGKLNLKEIAVFLKYTKVMISVEACTMHMAQALDIPVVALFGPTSPLIYGPCGNRDVTLVHKLNCMPCNIKKECLHHKCIEEIPVDDIVDKVAERIQ